MIKLIKHRSKKLIDNKSFKNETEINQHISLIEKAKVQLKDDIRLLELKNWINYLKENN
jgi:GMP synthase (glutamine-hydrolysing)